MASSSSGHGHSGSGGGASGPPSGSFTTTTLSMENCSLAAATSLCELANSVKERQGMWIFGETESKRRVIIIEKKNGSYGFTLQSYGVRYKHGNRETDFITYVNAVERDGAAFASGLREGDVILSINGQNMARVEHKSLVNYIRKCPLHLKMVVVSDERARKVELHMRYVHLQKKLQDKMRELEDLQRQERDILSGESNSMRRSSSPSPLSGPCIAAAAAKVCCFCPPTKAEKMEAKEKSKSIGSTSGVAERLMKGKENLLYYDSYRKSQSTRELHKEQNSSCGKLVTTTQKASSGGDIITLSAASNNNNSLMGSKENSSSTITASTTQPLSSSHLQQQHRPGCYKHHGSGGNMSSGSTPVSGLFSQYPIHSSQTPTPTQPNVAKNNPGGSTSTGATISSGYVSDSAQKYSSSSGAKPKSWDNLMGTKSFGGYGFGFGYGYFPQRTPGPEGTYPHFTHPHHHNHHHCSNHLHSNYYYKQKSQQNEQGNSTNEPSTSTTATASYAGTGPPPCSASHHRYHAYPSRNAAGSAVRSSFGASPQMPMSPDNVNSSVHNSRTLPLLKTSASRTSESSSGMSLKMEKTLSDSSLNSEHHKDFPKAMSYFRASENEDTHYSSEDEYDQYGTEASYDGKRIFV